MGETYAAIAPASGPAGTVPLECASYSEFYRVVLRDLDPYDGEEHPDFMIISDCPYTLGHPALGMRVDRFAKMILSGNVSRTLGSVSKREQPLYAVVTGMGRGKTRFLVELQRELNSNPLDVTDLDSAVFCVAITFNNQWDYIYYPYRFSRGEGDPASEAMEMVYAVNIVARLLSMVFHINYNIACDIMAPVFTMDVSISDRAGFSQPMALIQECVKYIVSRCPPKGTRKINHFVLLVDESVSAQEDLGNSFLDIHRVLREALLTYSIELDGEILKVDLVMSALNLTPLGLKNSNRR
eukprot:gene169-170_t